METTKKISVIDKETGKVLKFKCTNNYIDIKRKDDDHISLGEFLYHRGNSGYYTNGNSKALGKYIHRVLWEVYHGRSIPAGFVVHHINEDINDNTKENLMLMEYHQHLSYHKQGDRHPFKGKKHSQHTKDKMKAAKQRTREAKYAKERTA